MASRRASGRMKVTLTLFFLVLVSGIMGIIAWRVGDGVGENKTHSNGEQLEQKSSIASSSVVTTQQVQVTEDYFNGNIASLGNFEIDRSTMTFKIVDSGSNTRLTGNLNINETTTGKDCGSDKDRLCIVWQDDRQLQITYKTFSSNDCYFIEWEALRCETQVLLDCLDLSGAHWYGGYQDWNQYWPLEQTSMELSAFQANDSYAKRIGGVQERYFISTQGIGVNISDDVPLYISINQTGDKKMCLMAKYEQYPYINLHKEPPRLHYKICVAENVRKIHDFMSSSIPKPFDIPDEKLFRFPIWSTWAQYHKDINQSIVLDFAQNIINNKFDHSQLEIDDDWTPFYGDIDFNNEKFPNASNMVDQLNKMGFRVTIWIHPFFNIESKTFLEAALYGFLVRQYDSPLPALVSWWDGKAAGILDVSNDNAKNWFLSKLKYLQTTYNISSFKFDAGETNWLPHVFANPFSSPNFYSTKWAELAFASDAGVRHQEVRVGVNTQQLPIFVRMLDKDSNWGYTNGLKTLINTALTFGILGYPFILPDMIGGNAYGGGIPDRELFIRWLEATALLPSMQFSIVPWQYDEEVVNISRKFVKLHEQYSDQIIQLAKEAQSTGAPIVRPLWWIAPEDKQAQTTDSEFLLGNTTLVAPVLDRGALSRDIYLPSGKWKSVLDDRVIRGPTYLRNYPVYLDQLPIFEKQSDE